MELSAAETLERTQWDTFWVPDYVRVVDRPELKLLASDRTDAVFGNSVVRLRAHAAEVPSLVAEVQALHPVRSRWLVPDTYDTRPLLRELERHHYASDSTYDVRSLDVGAARPEFGQGLTVERVQTATQLRDVYRVAEGAFGSPVHRSDDDLTDELQMCADPSGRVHRFVVYADGRAVCSGGLNRYPDLQFGFLWAGGTLPEARGRGAYTALVTARMRWAAQLGLRRVGLYAKVDTSSPILERQGFEHGGSMSYWDRGEP